MSSTTVLAFVSKFLFGFSFYWGLKCGYVLSFKVINEVYGLKMLIRVITIHNSSFYYRNLMISSKSENLIFYELLIWDSFDYFENILL